VQRGTEGRSVADLLARWRLSASARRVNPGRGGLLAMISVAALVALLVGGWVLSSRPHRIPVSATVEASASALSSPARQSSAAVSSSSAAGLVVDVAGKVRHPGVYRLPAGARVQDAVTAAGGITPGVDPISINLARKLTDGEQVVVGLPTAGQPASGQSATGQSATGTGSSSGAAGPVDLNTATTEQLDALPGVGPVLAQRIVDWRTQHGRFASVDELSNVSGIGEAKLADLKPLVTVS
jgi:competence protein ComEA